MKLNKYQKRSLMIGLIISGATILIWLAFGAEFFTKNQVLVEKTDELLGVKYSEWKDQFILGLDYTLIIIFIITLITTTTMFIFRNKSDNG